MSEHAALVRGLGFVAGGALFWVMYFDLKDRLRPEPRRLLVASFFLGAVAAVLALGLYRLAPLLGLPADPGVEAGDVAFYCFAVVGPIEEGAKFIVARAVILRWKHFDEPIDGLIYSSSVAIGFAAFENVLYLQWLEPTHQLARALVSPLTHSLFSAIWGFGLSQARFHARGRGSRWAWQAGTLGIAMLAHGLYDALILAWEALIPTALVVLVLWVGTIAYARRAVRRA